MSYPASDRWLCLNTELFLLHLGTKKPNVSEGSEVKVGEAGTEQHTTPLFTSCEGLKKQFRGTAHMAIQNITTPNFDLGQLKFDLSKVRARNWHTVMLSLRAANLLSVIIHSSFPCKLLNTVFAMWSRAKPRSPWHPPQQRQWRHGDLTLPTVTQGNFQNSHKAYRGKPGSPPAAPHSLRPLNFTRRTQRQDWQLQPLPVRSGIRRRDHLRQPLREETHRPPGTAPAGTPGAAPLSLQSRSPGALRADSPELEPRRWVPARAPRCCTPGPAPPRASPAGAGDPRAAPTPPPCGPRHSEGGPARPPRHRLPSRGEERRPIRAAAEAALHAGNCSPVPLGRVVSSEVPGGRGPAGPRGAGSQMSLGSPASRTGEGKASTDRFVICLSPPLPRPFTRCTCAAPRPAGHVGPPWARLCKVLDRRARTAYSNKSPQRQAEDQKSCYQQ